MNTYRAEVTVQVEITSSEPLTEAQVRALADEAVSVDIPVSVGSVLGVGIRGEPSVSIDEPWCSAVVRRNSVDGRLYACSMAAGAPEHGPVEACPHPGGCDKPDEHHVYMSPGFDAPIEAEAVAS